MLARTILSGFWEGKRLTKRSTFCLWSFGHMRLWFTKNAQPNELNINSLEIPKYTRSLPCIFAKTPLQQITCVFGPMRAVAQFEDKRNRPPSTPCSNTRSICWMSGDNADSRAVRVVIHPDTIYCESESQRLLSQKKWGHDRAQRKNTMQQEIFVHTWMIQSSISWCNMLLSVEQDGPMDSPKQRCKMALAAHMQW